MPTTGSVISLPWSAGSRSGLGTVVSSRPLGSDPSVQSVTVRAIGAASDSAAAGATIPSGVIDAAAEAKTSSAAQQAFNQPVQTSALTPNTIAAINALSWSEIEGDLSASEKAALARLRQAHSAVIQEEQAHAANAGAYAGPPVYQYRTGPDGQRYAVAGSVGVKSSNPSGDPDEAARIAARIGAAAQAPNNPSTQDMFVARSAAGNQAAAGISSADVARAGGNGNTGLAAAIAAGDYQPVNISV